MVLTSGAAGVGLAVAAKRSLDGGAQASATGTVTELAGGQYNFAPSQADTNANVAGYLFTATGAVPTHLTVVLTAADPTDAVGFGLSRLDAAVGSRMATFTYTAPDNAGVAVVKAKTDQLAFGDSGFLAVDVYAIRGDTLLADAGGNLAAGFRALFGRMGSDPAAVVWSSAGRTLTAFGFSVTVGANADKAGYSLSAAGLDVVSIADPSGSPSGWTFTQRLNALWRRFFGRVKKDAGARTVVTYKADGTTVMATQSYSTTATTDDTDDVAGAV